jgi:hypothetical protein
VPFRLAALPLPSKNPGKGKDGDLQGLESARRAKLFAGSRWKLGSSCSHDSNDATTQFVADDAEDSSSPSLATISRDFIYDGLRYSTADPSVFGGGKFVKMVPSIYIHRNDFSGKVYTAIPDSRNGHK